MHFGYLFAVGKSYAVAFVFLFGIKPLEDAEYLIVMLRVNADAIISYRKFMEVSFFLAADFDVGACITLWNFMALAIRFWNSCRSSVLKA